MTVKRTFDGYDLSEVQVFARRAADVMIINFSPFSIEVYDISWREWKFDLIYRGGEGIRFINTAGLVLKEVYIYDGLNTCLSGGGGGLGKLLR